jgi:hypothetical protein
MREHRKLLGDIMQLLPKSKKGKERCKRDGNMGWEIFSEVDTVFFSDRLGPWWYIDNGSPNAARWIHSTDDKDFKLITTEQVK